MQVPNEKKRRQITDAAAKMFATRPFHRVKLSDIAAAAGVGKGTLYVYFSSKEDLYFGLIYDAFARMVDRLKERVSAGTERGADDLAAIVRELVGFAFANPHYFELTRMVGKVRGQSESAWNHKRQELSQLIEEALRRGIKSREFHDPHPELTAPLIPGFVRSLFVFGPRGLDEETVSGHIIRLLERGIIARKPS
jgi:AcrR family transcriptional regulator